MNNIKNRIMRFLYGRYGVDELYYFLFAIWAVITVINMFYNSIVLYLIGLIAMVIMLVRALSKNHQKRLRENRVFMKFWKPVKSFFVLQKDRLRDMKTVRYRKCPECKAIIKLPKKRGKHTTVCPRCGNRFKVNIL